MGHVIAEPNYGSTTCWLPMMGQLYARYLHTGQYYLWTSNFANLCKKYFITQTKLNLVDVARCGARFAALRHPLTVSDCLDRPDNDGTKTSPLTCESS